MTRWLYFLMYGTPCTYLKWLFQAVHWRRGDKGRTDEPDDQIQFVWANAKRHIQVMVCIRGFPQNLETGGRNMSTSRLEPLRWAAQTTLKLWLTFRTIRNLDEEEVAGRDRLQM